MGIEGIDGFDEVLGGPGVVLQIQVLVGTGLLEGVQVDGHAVGRHDQGILIDRAVGVGAGGHGGGVDLALIAIVKHIAQVHQVALVAPVGHQALGTFHDQVGGIFRGDGGVDLIVSVGVGQVFHFHGDTGVGGESVGDGLDLFLLAPVADGIGPQGQFPGGGGLLRSLGSLGTGLGLVVGGGLGIVFAASAGGKGHDHGHGQYNCK